ncbi:MAG: YceI family protein [Calditrichia bacterium]
MVHRMLISLIAGLCLVGGLFASGTYVIDPVHSNIGFSVRHMVISNVEGEFQEVDAVLTWDEDNPENSAIKATVQTSSIDTDNEKRDNHLRSADFFDSETHPEMTFESKNIKKVDENEYIAKGDLTIRGITREVEVPITILGKIKDPYGNTRIGAQSSFVVNRHDFNLNWNKMLESGGLVVGEDVKINLDVQMIKQSD